MSSPLQKELARPEGSDRTHQNKGNEPKRDAATSAPDARSIHGAELLLELADLVAEPGGELELQLSSRGMHLVLQLLDEQRQIVPRKPGELRSMLTGRLALAGHPWHRGLAARLGAAAAADQLLLVTTHDVVEDVGDLLAQRLRIDAVGLVVGHLLLSPAVGLLDRLLHGRGDGVGVHVHLAGDVARGAADGLDERCARPEESFLVGVEDRDERQLRQVETLAQEVDADEHVELAHPQLTEQLEPPQRVDFAVEVADADTVLEEV